MLASRISVSFGCILQTQAKGCGPHSFLSAYLLDRDFSSQLLSLPCEMKDNLHWEFFTLFIMSSKLKMQSFERGKGTSAPLIIGKEDTDIKWVAITGICLDFILIYGLLSYPALCVSPQGHLCIQKYVFNIPLLSYLFRFC